MPRNEHENTGHRDSQGRVIYRGPRGGLFVKTNRGKSKPTFGRASNRGARPNLAAAHHFFHSRRGQQAAHPAAVPAAVPELPGDVLGHIAKMHPHAAARLAVAGHRNAASTARHAKTAAAHAAKKWRNKSSGLDKLRQIVKDVMATRALKVRRLTPEVRNALRRHGFGRDPEARASEASFIKQYRFDGDRKWLIHVDLWFETGEVDESKARLIIRVANGWEAVATLWYDDVADVEFQDSRSTGNGLTRRVVEHAPSDVEAYMRDVAPHIFGV